MVFRERERERERERDVNHVRNGRQKVKSQAVMKNSFLMMILDFLSVKLFLINILL